ncbi:MAG: hypothetical protein MUE38_09315, partial [Flavihumibacter sp.]|nr:hypothetical protein [Flavihumibacter sp.]
MKKILMAALLVSLVFTACMFNTGKKVRGDGNSTSSNRTPGSFSAVEQKGSFDVELLVGDQHAVM